MEELIEQYVQWFYKGSVRDFLEKKIRSKRLQLKMEQKVEAMILVKIKYRIIINPQGGETIQ